MTVPSAIDHHSTLALAAKLRQRSLAPFVEKVREGGSLAAPVVVELDVTTFCDLACPECISGPLLNRGRFTNERLMTIVKEMATSGVRAVILIGGGEPLLHPVVDQVIQALAEAGIAVGLTTNGTQISRHLAVIADHVAWTRVSIDAASAATYNLFRPRRGGTRNTFSEIMAGISTLAPVKTGALGYSFLLIARRDRDGTRILHDNFADVAAAARLARDIGCDYVEFKPEYDMDHKLIAQPRRLRELLSEQLAEAVALESESFHVISPMSLDRVIADEALDEPKAYHRCPTIELRTLITPSGAYLCPYHRGNENARYGDPLTEGFQEMWGSEERKAAADRIDPSRQCAFSCIRHESNELLRGGTDLPSEVDDYDWFI